MEKIHTTIGVYPNSEVGNMSSVKVNGVLEEHLSGHIDYNKKWRFGRALFVDGVCVYQGCVCPEKIKEWENTLQSFPPLTKCTAPYQ